MGALHKETFICIDCETTGLDTKKDRIIEIAAVKFTFESILLTKETLVNPGMAIPPESTAIHNITGDMVENMPSIKSVLPEFLEFIGNGIIVGHGIQFDITMVKEAALREGIPTKIDKNKFIDTLRLARLYGESSINSLEHLRRHFNIEAHGAHRAMNDVLVNIRVFKHLAHNFRSSDEIFARLAKPIALKTMPLGKHKGRYFKEIPVEYLRWALRQDFDEDLLFSIKSELKKRKEGSNFSTAANPFHNL